MSLIPNQNPLKKLTDAWPYLSPWQRKALLAVAHLYVMRSRLVTLRPIHLLFPISILQLTSFISAALDPPHFIPIFATINLLAAALALLPLALRQSNVKKVGYHATSRNHQ